MAPFLYVHLCSSHENQHFNFLIFSDRLQPSRSPSPHLLLPQVRRFVDGDDDVTLDELRMKFRKTRDDDNDDDNDDCAEAIKFEITRNGKL